MFVPALHLEAAGLIGNSVQLNRDPAGLCICVMCRSQNLSAS